MQKLHALLFYNPLGPSLMFKLLSDKRLSRTIEKYGFHWTTYHGQKVLEIVLDPISQERLNEIYKFIIKNRWQIDIDYESFKNAIPYFETATLHDIFLAHHYFQ